MIDPPILQVAIGVISTFIAFAFAWVSRVFAAQKDRDERIGSQLRDLERMMRDLGARTPSDLESQRAIMVVLERLAGQDAVAREAVRRELSFLAKRMVKLERTAPLAVRCDPSEVGDGDVRCPYCHGGLGDVDLVRCSRCEAKQHRDCHESHGGCAVFGCGNRETRSVGTRVA